MICLNCWHMENLDYVHGCAICAALEGETVIPHNECVCPANVRQRTEKLLVDNGKMVFHTLYNHDNGIDNKRGYVDIVKKNGKIFAKWHFEDTDEYRPVMDLKPLPLHHFADAPLVHTFTFGGWRYWLCDVVREKEKLYDADPNCEHNIVPVLSGGIKCTKCGGWFCY